MLSIILQAALFSMPFKDSMTMEMYRFNSILRANNTDFVRVQKLNMYNIVTRISYSDV